MQAFSEKFSLSQRGYQWDFDRKVYRLTGSLSTTPTGSGWVLP